MTWSDFRRLPFLTFWPIEFDSINSADSPSTQSVASDSPKLSSSQPPS